MLGPVFRHEMFAAGRKRRYTLLRVVLGLLLLLALVICHQSAITQSRYASGVYVERPALSIAARSQLTASFFYSFAWTTLVGVLAAAPAVSAGAIASERERRTIEYLFVTDLSNAEIVFDKLMARLMVIGQVVLCTLPLLAIFRLLGGLPGDLLLLHFASLASTAFCVASLSLMVSTWSQRAREAVPQAYGALLVFLTAPGILALLNFLVLLEYAPLVAQWTTLPLQYAMQAVNPVLVLGQSWGMTSGLLGIDLDTRAILVMIAGQVAIGAGCLGVCVYAVRRVHLRTTGEAERPVKSHRRGSRIRTPYERRPILWKEMFAASVTPRKKRVKNRVAAILTTLVLGGLILWQFFLALVSPRAESHEEYFVWAAFVLGVGGGVTLLYAGIRAAGLVAYEKERQTWDSILTTPLSAEEIVLDKILGNLYTFRWVYVGLLLVLVLGGVLYPPGLLLVPVEAYLLAVTGVTATMVGLLASLQVKSSVKAIGVTIAALVFMGGGYFPLVAMFGVLVSSEELMALALAPCVPFLIVGPFICTFGTPPGEVVGALVMGAAGYGALAFILVASAQSHFDHFCGRGAGDWQSQETDPWQAPLATSSQPPAEAGG